MRSGPGTVVASASSLVLALAASGCLLAYDFDEYGSGGADPSGSSGSSEASQSASSGGGEELTFCEDGDVRLSILPVGWTDVLVGRVGNGFIAAPRDALSYVTLGEGQTPALRERFAGTNGLQGLVQITVEGAIRNYGALPAQDGLQLSNLDAASTSNALGGDAEFRSVQQPSADFGAMLYTAIIGPYSSAGLGRCFWSRFGQPVVNGIKTSREDDGIAYCPTEDCDIVSAAMSEVVTDIYFGAIVGNAHVDTLLNAEPIVKGPFFVGLTPNEEHPAYVDEEEEEVFDVAVQPFGDALDLAFDVEPSDPNTAFVFSGILDDANAFGFSDQAASSVVTAGPAHADAPSRLTGPYWLLTEWDGDTPTATLSLTRGTRQPILSLPRARSFELAMADRLDGNHVGVLVSVEVGDEGAELGGCSLPANRWVLMEVERTRGEP